MPAEVVPVDTAFQKPFLVPMNESHVEPAVELISRAMNADEGQQAYRTLQFHFSCAKHAIDDGRTYFVSTDSHKLTGVAGLHHYAWGPPENVWLAWFAVHPELHSCGLGTSLLTSAEENARQFGYMKLFVETYSTPEFAKARRFYKRHGFVLAGGIASYLPNGGNMVVYRKELSHAL